MERGAWRAMVHRVTESDTTKVTWHALIHTYNVRQQQSLKISEACW